MKNKQLSNKGILNALLRGFQVFHILFMFLCMSMDVEIDLLLFIIKLKVLKIYAFKHIYTFKHKCNSCLHKNILKLEEDIKKKIIKFLLTIIILTLLIFSHLFIYPFSFLFSLISLVLTPNKC